MPTCCSLALRVGTVHPRRIGRVRRDPTAPPTPLLFPPTQVGCVDSGEERASIPTLLTPLPRLLFSRILITCTRFSRRAPTPSQRCRFPRRVALQRPHLLREPLGGTCNSRTRRMRRDGRQPRGSQWSPCHGAGPPAYRHIHFFSAADFVSPVPADIRTAATRSQVSSPGDPLSEAEPLEPEAKRFVQWLLAHADVDPDCYRQRPLARRLAACLRLLRARASPRPSSVSRGSRSGYRRP